MEGLIDNFRKHSQTIFNFQPNFDSPLRHFEPCQTLFFSSCTYNVLIIFLLCSAILMQQKHDVTWIQLQWRNPSRVRPGPSRNQRAERQKQSLKWLQFLVKWTRVRQKVILWLAEEFVDIHLYIFIWGGRGERKVGGGGYEDQHPLEEPGWRREERPPVTMSPFSDHAQLRYPRNELVLLYLYVVTYKIVLKN